MGKKEEDILQQFLRLVGANVKKYRKARNMTLEELGYELGLEKPQIYFIEAGRNITLSTILRLAAALKVKPHELIKTDINMDAVDLDVLIKPKSPVNKIGKEMLMKARVANKKGLTLEELPEFLNDMTKDMKKVEKLKKAKSKKKK